MRPSIVKAKLARGEPVLLTTVHFTDPSVFELVGLMGFDGIFMDLEHHAYSVETANQLMRAARVGRTDIMCRPAKGEFMRMGRCLEAGAQGILYPRCDDAAEARQVVQWCKFAPLGRRGFDGGNPDQPYCSMPLAEYVRQANAQTWLGVQLEDPQAIEHAESIAGVEGIDVLFLGPGDFSLLSGIPGQFDHPKVQHAIDALAKAARNTGKAWGLPAGTPARVKELLDLGARYIKYGADIIFVKLGLEQIQKDLGSLGFSFDNQLG